MKESSRDCWRAWHCRSVTASAPRFCTRMVTVWGSPATAGKRMCPLPLSCSETISIPCFSRMNSALQEGRVRPSQPGWGIPGAMLGQGAASRTTSWHGSGALVDRSWAAALGQLRTPTPMPLRSFWVSGTGLPPPRASSPVRSSQHQRGPGVLLGGPAEPVPVGMGAAVPPQPGASLTFLKCTESMCTCTRWVTLSAYKMQEKLGIFVSVLHRQGREVSAWNRARLGCTAGLLGAQESKRRRVGREGEARHRGWGEGHSGDSPLCQEREEGLQLFSGLCKSYIPTGCSSNSMLWHSCSSCTVAVPAVPLHHCLAPTTTQSLSLPVHKWQQGRDVSLSPDT